MAARFVQPTGREATVQIKQVFKFVLTQVSMTVIPASATGPFPGTDAVAGAAGARAMEAEARTALRREKRARDLNMVKDRKRREKKAKNCLRMSEHP